MFQHNEFFFKSLASGTSTWNFKSVIFEHISVYATGPSVSVKMGSCNGLMDIGQPAFTCITKVDLILKCHMASAWPNELIIEQS